MTKYDAWKILGLTPGDYEHLQEAFSRQAVLHHPEDDPAGYTRIHEAYDLLKNHSEVYVEYEGEDTFIKDEWDKDFSDIENELDEEEKKRIEEKKQDEIKKQEYKIRVKKLTEDIEALFKKSYERNNIWGFYMYKPKRKEYLDITFHYGPGLLYSKQVMQELVRITQEYPPDRLTAEEIQKFYKAMSYKDSYGVEAERIYLRKCRGTKMRYNLLWWGLFMGILLFEPALIYKTSPITIGYLFIIHLLYIFIFNYLREKGRSLSVSHTLSSLVAGILFIPCAIMIKPMNEFVFFALTFYLEIFFFAGLMVLIKTIGKVLSGK